MKRTRTLLAAAAAGSLALLPAGAAHADDQGDCMEFVADPGGSGCMWFSWYKGFGQAQTDSHADVVGPITLGGTPVSGSASATPQGQFHLVSGPLLPTQSSVTWPMHTPMSGMDDLQLSGGLDLTHVVSGQAATSVKVNVGHDGVACSPFTIVVPAGQQHIAISQDITPNDCPTLFDTTARTLDVAVTVVSVSHQMNDTYDVTGQLNDVSAFFHTPGCFDGFGETCTPCNDDQGAVGIGDDSGLRAADSEQGHDNGDQHGASGDHGDDNNGGRHRHDGPGRRRDHDDTVVVDPCTSNPYQ